MPEGPELRLSCDTLKNIIKNKYIINSYIGKTSRYQKEDLQGYDPQKLQCDIVDVNVKGKFMYWALSNGQYMFCTYGMTGQWLTKEDKHTCFAVQYVDKFETIEQAIVDSKFLYFNDPRHFGTLKFVNSKAELDEKLNSLGWDPFSESLDSKFSFLKKKIKKNKPIGEILMNQSIFCGVGNYIRAEALYRSKLNPWKNGKDISEDMLTQLCKHIIDVMNESYRAQGATFSTYENVDGESGKYAFNFQIYGQKNDPQGYNVIREEMGSRTIHWCPEVQKE
jgi:formamidopyrimidine-DNA glycosylase